ncbi:alpha-L-rhamnosidase [Shouchella clausii]|uniref:alpha-L-rhamnosidase n=1 Tax=Shouchella clausii TaxID=79880 RepID=UPI000BA66215|nr:alpha-L-rhamnosidase [Shouchella clausii]PAE96859.1 alpha-L-rhamnosidase [Shouchella clausii]
MIAVKEMRCEDRLNPIGLDRQSPQFSWITKSDRPDYEQTRYEIQVSMDAEGKEAIWSKRVFSSQSLAVRYEGPPLESYKRYYWRVRVWAGEEKSDWSGASFFEMGILEATEWKGDWITSAANSDANTFACARQFQAKKPITKAILYATSLGLYELMLNGQRVGHYALTPGWTNYHDRIQYQAYDVSFHLKETNELRALVGEGWYSGYLGWKGEKNTYGNTNALLLQLRLVYEDGSVDWIYTDESWQELATPIQMSDLYNGETYDGRIQFEQIGDMRIFSYPKAHLVAQENEPVAVIEQIRPKRLLRTPKQELVLDMGQNMVGVIEFKVRGKEGQKLQLIHGEVLDHEGNFYRANLRAAEQTVSYICSGEGEAVYRPHFTFQGFQFVKLVGFSEDVSIDDFTGLVMHSDMEQTGDFHTSDSSINQLQHNILWGQKGNFVDVPTDCPQRNERLGWTGDAQIFIRTANFNMGTKRFFQKWLRDLAYNQSGDGSVPFVVPDILNGEFSGNKGRTCAAWGDAAVICPWTLYWSFGDEQVLYEQYESMKAWVDYIRSTSEDGLLWQNEFQLGDWLALDAEENSYYGATDNDLVASAYYAYSTKLLAKTARVIGKVDDYHQYKALFKQIKQAYQKAYMIAPNRLYSDTQTAYVLTLHFGLAEETQRQGLAARLVELIRQNGTHLTTGFVGTPYLCHALSDNGYTDVAYELLFQRTYPSWLYQVDRGATTMWEHWDSIKEDGSFWSTDMNSFNHYAYGSIGDWMYQHIIGLDAVQAGYKTAIIAPKPTEKLTYATGTLKTPYGKLASEWHLQGETLTIKGTVPENTSAYICFPAVANQEEMNALNINPASIAPEEAETVFRHMRPDSVLIKQGSGPFSYTYQARMAKQ